MSQPPLPYSPQPFPPDFGQYQSGFDPLAPARRAGLMLLIIAALTIAVGACSGIVGLLVPLGPLIEQSHVDTSQLPPGMTPAEFMKAACIVAAFLCVPLGILMGVCGFFVRRGARWACIVAIVCCALPLLYIVFDALVVLSHGLMNPQVLAGAFCMLVVPAVVLALTLAWLIGALRSLPGVAYAQQQYQMQLWQHQQQQAAYQQPPPATAPSDPWQRGYGMTPPPPPPDVPPAPPGV